MHDDIQENNVLFSKQPVPFTQIPNALIANPNISAKAKAVYCYIFSRPEGWIFYIQNIINNMKEGKKAIRVALKELEEFGYIRRTQLKSPQGKWLGSEIEIRTEPATLEPPTLKPPTPEGHAVKETHNNTNSSNTDSSNTEHNISSDLFPDTKAKKKTKSQPMTIEEWEKLYGVFDIKMLAAWGREKNLDANKILPKVEEYRLQWKAKGYKYANFVAAFQQWINRDGLDKYKKTTQPDALPAARFTEGNEL